MKIIYNSITVLLFTILLTSCEHNSLISKENPVDPPPSPDPKDPIVLVECSKDSVFFVQTVLPLVTTLCGKAGCHIEGDYSNFYIIYNGGTQSENLLNSYNAIKDRFSSTTSLENNINTMNNQNVWGFVPPDDTQLQELKTWINQGSKLNSCANCDENKFAYTENIKPILSTYCVSCHNSTSAMASVNLSTYEDVVNELTLNPGRLVGSIEWTDPYTGDKAMPYGSGKLPDCYINQIKNWINAGALND
jgi:hypothetical protein